MSSPDKVVVAVDIGGTKLAAGLMTLRGELIDRAQVAVDHSLDEHGLFDSLAELTSSMIERATGHHHLVPVAIGVGSAGPIQGNVDTISPLNIEAWRDFPLRSRLEEQFALPVHGDLDAKSLALAEGWLGAAQGSSNFLAMVVSTGVGGGLVLNGQLLDGATGNAGHIGHVVVEPNGRRCSCGSRGCLEAEASGRAIEAITGRSPSEPTYEIMQRTGDLVGRAVASACNLLDLDLVVVGGSVALGFGATFFNSAQAALDRHARLDFSRGARVPRPRLVYMGPLSAPVPAGLRGLRPTPRPSDR